MVIKSWIILAQKKSRFRIVQPSKLIYYTIINNNSPNHKECLRKSGMFLMFSYNLRRKYFGSR